jgi:hypothetical protein
MPPQVEENLAYYSVEIWVEEQLRLFTHQAGTQVHEREEEPLVHEGGDLRSLAE